MSRVKKFLITILDEKVNIDSVHDALSKITDAHLTTWEEDTQKLRTRHNSGDTPT